MSKSEKIYICIMGGRDSSNDAEMASPSTLLSATHNDPNLGADTLYCVSPRQPKLNAIEYEPGWLHRTIRKKNTGSKVTAGENRHMQIHRTRNGYFERLPAELILELARHTHPSAIGKSQEIVAIFRDAFEGNKTAVLRGMEDEQFQQLKWLFGDSKRRSPSQTQALKDYITTSLENRNNDTILTYLDRVDDNVFSVEDSIRFMQTAQDKIDQGIEAFLGESIQHFGGRLELKRRTTLCLAAFAFRRAEVFGEISTPQVPTHTSSPEPKEDDRAIEPRSMPWEERIAMFQRQPVGTQCEIGFVLQLVVERVVEVCDFLGAWTKGWVQEYYESEDLSKKMDPAQLKKWFTKVAVAFAMATVLDFWGESVKDLMERCETGFDDFEDLVDKEAELYEYGSPKADQNLQLAIEFVQSVGFNSESSPARIRVRERFRDAQGMVRGLPRPRILYSDLIFHHRGPIADGNHF